LGGGGLDGLLGFEGLGDEGFEPVVRGSFEGAAGFQGEQVFG